MISNNPVYQENFSDVLAFDNVEAVTLKLKPLIWDPNTERVFLGDFSGYCSKRKIDFCLFREQGRAGNVHYHGIMGFPGAPVRKRFQTWFNKYYGFLHVSDKVPGDGWYGYCTKDQPTYRSPSPDYVPNLKTLWLFGDENDEVKVSDIDYGIHDKEVCEARAWPPGWASDGTPPGS